MDLAMTSSAAFQALQAPLRPEVPPRPSQDFWTSTQWTVFMAIMDIVIPAIVPKSSLVDKQGQRGIPDLEYAALIKTAENTVLETSDPDALTAFLQDKPSRNPIFRDMLVRTLCRLPEKQRNALGWIMAALSSSAGSFVLTGSCTPFHQQAAHTREAVLQGWRNSWSPTMRRVSGSLIRLGQIGWLMDSPIFRQVTGYPDVPVRWKPVPGFAFAFLQFPARPGVDYDDEAGGRRRGAAASALPSAAVETDVVVVGSGCGGAVAAKVLAEAGHRVLVVDKGYYFPPAMLPMRGGAGGASSHLFDSAVLATADGSVTVLAGAAWGGGGTVNWSVALQTQDVVRRAWAAQGLGFFAGPEYQACMDRVCARMGVSTEKVVQSHRGRVLLEGARKLGWKAEVCPQNSGGKEHSCGHCTLGCGSGEKQGPTACWLPDAAAAGAEFMEGFAVDRITWEEEEEEEEEKGEAGKRRATGVVGTWTSRDPKGGMGADRVVREVIIKAKRVIVACGALRSPLLLTASGLTNPNIGRNLYLHPTASVGAFFDEDTKPWEGAIITSYCTEFSNLDGQGHGVHLETTNMTPYTCYAQMPWRAGVAYKRAALRYRHLAAFIAVARDRDPGRVSAAAPPGGSPATAAPHIAYTPSAFDRAHMLAGVLALCRLLRAARAREIDPFITGVAPFVRADDDDDDDDDDARFAAWLAEVRRLGSSGGGGGGGGGDALAAGSAHQMGSCRMSATAAAGGVVDARGRVWGARGLYVADASVFPSASAVNPMVTVMAIADWIARAVDADLKGRRGAAGWEVRGVGSVGTIAGTAASGTIAAG